MRSDGCKMVHSLFDLGSYKVLLAYIVALCNRILHSLYIKRLMMSGSLELGIHECPRYSDGSIDIHYFGNDDVRGLKWALEVWEH